MARTASASPATGTKANGRQAYADSRPTRSGLGSLLTDCAAAKTSQTVAAKSRAPARRRQACPPTGTSFPTAPAQAL